MAAETAEAKLVTSENSWKQQKQALDQEISDLNARYVGVMNGEDYPLITCEIDVEISLLRTPSSISTLNPSAHKPHGSNRCLTPLQPQSPERVIHLTMLTPNYPNFDQWSRTYGKRRK